MVVGVVCCHGYHQLPASLVMICLGLNEQFEMQTANYMDIDCTDNTSVLNLQKSSLRIELHGYPSSAPIP